MSEFWLGAAAGAPTGAAIAVLVTVAVLRHRAAATTPLTEQDREVVAHEFKTHAEAMQQQVSEYADALAGGDLVLRERLRQFEARR